MAVIRWMAMLALCLTVSGCGVLELFSMAGRDAQPTQVEQEPPTLYMLRGHIAFPMDRGGYCWVWSEDESLCVETFIASYNPDMHTLVIGNTLELLFDEPLPDTVTVSLHSGSYLLTDEGDIEAEAAMDENGRMLVTVPDHLNGNYVLAVFARWAEGDMPYGDAFYAAPVRFET